jgi:hypothetical protein
MEPAFGIGEVGTVWNAFPPGALVFEFDATVDGFAWHRQSTNTEPIYVRASDGWLMIQGIDGLWQEFQDLPCNGITEDILMWMDFESVAALAQPPSISINVPTHVECPGLLDLVGTLTDPDGDAHVRWYVDGVLIAESTTTIPITDAHALAAIAVDMRGAAKSVQSSVSCD